MFEGTSHWPYTVAIIGITTATCLALLITKEPLVLFALLLILIILGLLPQVVEISETEDQDDEEGDED